MMRVAKKAATAVERDTYVKRGAPALVHLARERARDGLNDVLRASTGKKAEMAKGEAEDGNLAITHDARGAQERAVTTEGNHEHGTRRVTGAVRLAFLVVRPDHLDTLMGKPNLERSRRLDGIRPRVIGNEKDLHTPLPSKPSDRTSVPPHQSPPQQPVAPWRRGACHQNGFQNTKGPRRLRSKHSAAAPTRHSSP